MVMLTKSVRYVSYYIQSMPRVNPVTKNLEYLTEASALKYCLYIATLNCQID